MKDRETPSLKYIPQIKVANLYWRSLLSNTDKTNKNYCDSYSEALDIIYEYDVKDIHYYVKKKRKHD